MDIRLQTSWVTHPKIIKLERRLGEPAVLALIRLWTWCGSSKTSGVLDGMAVDDIELAAQWSGEDGALVPVLVSLRLLDVEDGTYIIHDWEANNPWASGQNARTEIARNAAMTRWGVKKQHAHSNASSMQNDARSNAESCSEHTKRCSEHKTALQNDARSIKNMLGASNSNAPSPSPYPSPTPQPDPVPTNINTNVVRNTPVDLYIPDNTSPEIKPKSFSVIATAEDGETYRTQNTARQQVAEAIELEPIQPGCKFFRAAELEIEQAKIYAHNRHIVGDYVTEAIAVVDGWLQSDEPKPTAARRQPSHGRYLTAAWVVDNVLRARKAIASQQTAGGRQQKPKTIHEKNAEFFEQFERENGLRPEPAQMVDVGTNVDDVEIIYPEE